MVKTLLISTALVAGTTSLAFADMQTGRSVATHHHRHHHTMMRRDMMPSGIRKTSGVAANGRCGGVSYGTGARRCGDETGGPSDGLGAEKN